MEIYRVEDLNFSYPLGRKQVLDNVSFTINQGEFVSICGKSGCGKTTLLRNLKKSLSPHGIKSGKIYFKNQELEALTQREDSSKIGYVLQDPDNQIVTDKVWHELAFGLESLGYDTETIRMRVSEMASFFGIQSWFYKEVTSLSGGQKQLLNLASIMAMQPQVLILDEPTSQLDPIAASEFIGTLKKINRDLGTTIIISEHRQEEVIPNANRVIVIENGKIVANCDPREIGKFESDNNSVRFAMTSPMKIYSALKRGDECPITVNEGRNWIDSLISEKNINTVEFKDIKREYIKEEPLIRLEDIWFRYEKNGEDILKGLSLEVNPNEIYAILGGNGTGKTTAISIISGIKKAYRGKLKIVNSKEKNILTLPQNPKNIFVKKTLKQDLEDVLEKNDYEKEDKIKEISKLVEIEDLLNSHPYDLSGGEQQRAGLAKILLMNPDILLLDEPTKGLDEYFKEKLAAILLKLKERGVTILLVSHDIEFCAKYANRCSLFFNGTIITTGDTRDFFAGNSFYTTASNRMVRHICSRAVTPEDVISICKRSLI